MSEETIRALAGHVSRKMLERYSHIRLAAKQAAIQSLEAAVFDAGSPRNPPQSTNGTDAERLVIFEKALN